MRMDLQRLAEYPFDGVFYMFQEDVNKGLLNQKVREVEVMRVKCDIQQTSQIGNAGFLASSYTIYFPLERADSLMDKGCCDDDCDCGCSTLPPSQSDMKKSETYKPVPIKRGMYFRGYIYGYEVNGKVIGVAPSMLGACACQIKDLDE